MNYSVTYISVIVLVLTYFFKLSGTEIASPEIQGIAENIIVLVAAGTALWRRYKAGGINIFGKRV